MLKVRDGPESLGSGRSRIIQGTESMWVINGGFNVILSSLYGALLEDGGPLKTLLLDHEIQIATTFTNYRFKILLKRL